MTCILPEIQERKFEVLLSEMKMNRENMAA